jgi:hypothetical protein
MQQSMILYVCMYVCRRGGPEIWPLHRNLQINDIDSHFTPQHSGRYVYKILLKPIKIL